MSKTLSQYIPENSVKLVFEILAEHPITIKIVNKRATKHGDFKIMHTGKTQITINNSLNQYQFLLTLIHEIAHFTTFKKHKRVKPHGIEWKRSFQHLMLPFLQPSIFPEELLPYLANYLKNPKASTGSDVHLTYALKQFDTASNTTIMVEIAHGSLFMYNNKTYKKGNTRRTRIECIELNSKKTYLFNQNAEVILLQ
ncbi:SprT-like family protein [Lutibacter agarilyticus]|uniref:SprT-like family protein n=1 Tax=Lutibacter agarilyticus TaxID=1109740 RepID=A0A238X5B1_9FLAO|nr:SprT-like domain-containing protein [Lutibacter agarilyticus]SNR53049.1 SprT-like family protein [Lutibacter agarilyticus]